MVRGNNSTRALVALLGVAMARSARVERLVYDMNEADDPLPEGAEGGKFELEMVEGSWGPAVEKTCAVREPAIAASGHLHACLQAQETAHAVHRHAHRRVHSRVNRPMHRRKTMRARPRMMRAHVAHEAQRDGHAQ